MRQFQEIREIYLGYMKDVAPGSSHHKIEVLDASMPDADSSTLAAIAWTQTTAEAVILAIVLYLARHDKL